MAYEFKKLSEVNAIEAISSQTNVLVEENGEIVKLSANSMIPEDVVTKTELEEAIEAIPEPVTSWNDLTDKPFYKTLNSKTPLYSKYSFPGTASLALPSSVGNIGEYQIVLNNVEYNYTIKVGTTNIGTQENFPFILQRNQTGPSQYTWTFKCSDKNSTNNSLQMYKMVYTLVKLDETFIPSAIARTENLIGQKTSSTNGEIFNDYKNNVASGNYAHAEGYSTEASGLASHSEGNDTNATATAAHAEGTNTKATATAAHAEGSYAEASGGNSHAEGYKTKATANQAHAEGKQTIAAGISQHAEGEFNISDDTSTYIHIAGNGISDLERSNAYTLDKSGNGWFSGDVYVGSTSGTNRDEGSKKLATEEYVMDAVSGGVTSWDDLKDKPFGNSEKRVLDLKYSGTNSGIADNAEGYRIYPNTDYIVIYDGEEYEVRSSDSNSSSITVEDPFGERLVYAWYDFEGDNVYVNIPEDGELHTVEAYKVVEIFATLDPEFLPTTIPVVNWAQAGQTLAVRAVDEYGTPTEWEAVDTAKEFSGSYNDLTNRPFYDEIIYKSKSFDLSEFQEISGREHLIRKLHYYSYPAKALFDGLDLWSEVTVSLNDFGALGSSLSYQGSYTLWGQYEISAWGNINMLISDEPDNGESACIFSGYSVMGGDDINGIIINKNSVDQCTICTQVRQKKTIDREFLPKATDVSLVTGDAPTAEDFNNLLNALERAGYLTITLS